MTKPNAELMKPIFTQALSDFNRRDIIFILYRPINLKIITEYLTGNFHKLPKLIDLRSSLLDKKLSRVTNLVTIRPRLALSVQLGAIKKRKPNQRRRGIG